MQFRQYIAELGRFGFPGKEGGAVIRRKVLTRVFPCFRLISPFLSRCRS